MESLINKAQQKWEEYRKKELARVLPIITELGFKLDEKQVHINGERYLMSGRKLVLTGFSNINGQRVIIKLSSQPEGIREIKHERKCRIVLHDSINFAYRTFFSPKEILFIKKRGCIIFITSYIEQKKPFTSYSLEEQFFLALRALETQEGVHATAYSHDKIIRHVFGTATTQKYIDSFKKFCENAMFSDRKNTRLAAALKQAFNFFSTHKSTIDLFSNFLTHTDFAPQNFRIVGRDIYLLDHTSIYFGNKYESWARFLNYMIIYSPRLQSTLADYVKQNRGPKEYLSLQLMRLYKIGFLLQYYTGTLMKTSGNLNKLNKERVSFWTRILELILIDDQIANEMVEKYRYRRDILRSREEKERQKELKQLL
jgi:hypothetical protein